MTPVERERERERKTVKGEGGSMDIINYEDSEHLEKLWQIQGDFNIETSSLLEISTSSFCSGSPDCGW